MTASPAHPPPPPPPPPHPPSGGLRIRPAVAGDAGALAALLNLIAPTEPGAPGVTAEALGRDVLSGAWNVEALAAELDGALVGVLLHQRSYETSQAQPGAYVLDLAVAPAARRLGVGRALLAECAAMTAARGGAYLWWLSPGRAAAAPGLYHAIADVTLELAAFAVTDAGFAALAAEGRARPR